MYNSRMAGCRKLPGRKPQKVLRPCPCNPRPRSRRAVEPRTTLKITRCSSVRSIDEMLEHGIKADNLGLKFDRMRLNNAQLQARVHLLESGGDPHSMELPSLNNAIALAMKLKVPYSPPVDEPLPKPVSEARPKPVPTASLGHNFWVSGDWSLGLSDLSRAPVAARSAFDPRAQQAPSVARIVKKVEEAAEQLVARKIQSRGVQDSIRSSIAHRLQAANRRKFYKLFIAKSGPDGVESADQLKILTQAKALNVPHEELCLKPRPWPQLPIASLDSFSLKNGKFFVNLRPQSREDVNINGVNSTIPYKSSGWRYPFLVWLHGVCTHIRSVSPSLRRQRGIRQRLQRRQSRRVPASKPNEQMAILRSSRAFASRRQSCREQHHQESPLAKGPCVLVLGNEDEGLPPWLVRAASDRLTIDSRADLPEDFDSLNVSVAAGLLSETFMRAPASSPALNSAASLQASETAQGAQPESDRLF
ncbi:hypothetical protein MRB53_041873 [Persea americana]|nr:hypothetical protein MRB53_041873 [Persea americana]